MLEKIVIIGFFGSMGAVARFLVSQLPKWLGLPIGTIIVNILGSFLLGLFFSISMEQLPFSPTLKIGVTTGFLGSFTTFSTFSLENAQLIQQGEIKLAIFNILFQLISGLLLALLGIWMGLQISTS